MGNYKYYWKPSPNYKQGRGGAVISTIVIHHWGVDGQKHDNVVNYLCRKGGNSSAHYVVSDGKVTQLVKEKDRAWHAGVKGNPIGIGIECRPEATAGDIQTVRELIDDIQARYGRKLTVTCHHDYMSTDCPGKWHELVKNGLLNTPPKKENQKPKKKEKKMICLFQPDNAGGYIYYDGHTMHVLDTEQQMKAIQEMYRRIHKEEIPVLANLKGGKQLAKLYGLSV